jgi:uncharacterized protein (TIGR02996 family)
MRTFIRSDGKSERFWHVERKGQQAVLTSGQAGGKARTQTRKFRDDFSARFECDELIAEKLAAGYVETTGMGEVSPLRRALEAALVADPDDRGSHMAYADWLAEQGDPRGEFISVQLALEDPRLPAGQRKKLQQRERALLRAHRADWLGPLAPLAGHGLLVQFARGWIDRVAVDFLTRPLASLLAWEPRLRLVRRLSVSYAADRFDEAEEEFAQEPPEPWEEGDGAVDLLARSPYLDNVRVLALGEVYYFAENDSEPSWYSREHLLFLGYTVLEWVAKMTRLEELYLAGTVSSWVKDLFQSKSLTHLRVLQLYHADEYPLKELAGNDALARLTHLSLRPCALDEYDDEARPLIALKDVRPLLKSPHLASLTHLRIQQTALGDRGCSAIARSGILKRLKFLDLARGSITDKGAHTLARCPDLRNLQVLDVSYNALTEGGVQALRAAGITVRAEDQHDEDDTHYLYEGEME